MKDHPTYDHKVEITEVDHAFFVSIDGLPLGNPQPKFSSAQGAYDAAEAAIARKRTGQAIAIPRVENPRKLMKITERMATIFLSLMHDCPALTNEHIERALMKAGYGEISARRMTGWFRARTNEIR